MQRNLRTILRDAWRLTAPYFNSEERWSARLLLLVVVALNLSLVGFNVVLNFWSGAMFDSLQQKDAALFTNLILFWRSGTLSFSLSDKDTFIPGFVFLATVYIAIAIYAIYLRQLLEIRWRTWLTHRLLGEWLTDRAYYTMGLQAAQARPGIQAVADNPDQRIAEDVRDFTRNVLVYGISLMRNVVSVISFGSILWTLSGIVTVWGVAIPGYMLFIAIGYAIVGTWLTHLVGRPLVGIEFDKQRLEADFRYSLIRVRENAEGVALYNGERIERMALLDRFAAVVVNWRSYMTREKWLNMLVNGYGQVASIFPLVVASPRYFAGEIQLGGLTRISGAFGQVQASLSWFVDRYDALAQLRAIVERLAGFQAATAEARSLAQGGVGVAAGPDGAVALEHVQIALPGGRVLMQDGNFTFPQGQATIISGRSGTGKSTLFRALAGLWPFGSGTVRRPPGRTLFLPQKPYIPLGTLRHAIAYPDAVSAYKDDAVRDALTAAGLGALAPELDANQPWTQRLSGGEQQRLAVARALLLRPDWLYLDEATSSLDPEAQSELYATLRTRLPGTTLISIAHRAEIATDQDTRLVFKEGTLLPLPPGEGRGEEIAARPNP